MEEIIFYCGTKLVDTNKIETTVNFNLDCESPIEQVYYTKYVDSNLGDLKCYSCGENLTNVEKLKEYKKLKASYSTVLPVCGVEKCLKNPKRKQIL